MASTNNDGITVQALVTSGLIAMDEAKLPPRETSLRRRLAYLLDQLDEEQLAEVLKFMMCR